MNYRYKAVFAFVALLCVADTVCAQENIPEVQAFCTPARDNLEISGPKEIFNWFGFHLSEKSPKTGPPFSCRSGFSEPPNDREAGYEGSWRRIEVQDQR